LSPHQKVLNANKKIGLESAFAGIRRFFLQTTDFPAGLASTRKLKTRSKAP
jgi:hypothetical protein